MHLSLQDSTTATVCWPAHRRWAPYGLRGCKNRAHPVSWPEVVKGVPNQGVGFSVSSFFCFSFVFVVYVVLCLIVFGCQYQCNWLPGKTRLWNDLLCVEWDVKPYTLTHAPKMKADRLLLHKSSPTCGSWTVIRLRRCLQNVHTAWHYNSSLRTVVLRLYLTYLAVVTCDVKLLWNNFVKLFFRCFVSH